MVKTARTVHGVSLDYVRADHIIRSSRLLIERSKALLASAQRQMLVTTEAINRSTTKLGQLGFRSDEPLGS